MRKGVKTTSTPILFTMKGGLKCGSLQCRVRNTLSRRLEPESQTLSSLSLSSSKCDLRWLVESVNPSSEIEFRLLQSK